MVGAGAGICLRRVRVGGSSWACSYWVLVLTMLFELACSTFPPSPNCCAFTLRQMPCQPALPFPSSSDKSMRSSTESDESSYSTAATFERASLIPSKPTVPSCPIISRASVTCSKTFSNFHSVSASQPTESLLPTICTQTLRKNQACHARICRA